ncbi:MAG: hypothetical protein ACREL5_06570 [Gemmatimonadales bacterium]
MNGRPHPFDILFGEFRADGFAAIRDDLGERSDVNDFLMSTPAIELMRELRPDEGLGDSVDEFVALLHAAYRYWRDGEVTRVATEPATRDLIEGRQVRDLDAPAAHYVQVAPRLIWGRLIEDSPFEPLDGWFVLPEDDRLRMVACFGVHADRPGVSVVALDGPSPGISRRADGTALFAPTLPGADAAGLAVVVAPEELLLLAWRAQTGKEMP